ncbi:hypothetical protein [Nocardia sp. CC227C]|uniref:hypothetical protein n=1 Tax=Nocardia sp. CC227C TaxID=3044562 RepID=UPI00278C56CA|nr:hypothetical protein [Nocardia sp. CC227C]
MATDTVPQPPYSPELLADLHAGNMPDQLSRRLWPQVRRDPNAMRYLRSLDRVNGDLRALGRDERVVHPMPAEVTARLERVIDDLANTPDPSERMATVHRLHPDRATPAATAPMPAVPPFDTGELTATDLDPISDDTIETDGDSDDFDDAPREPAPWTTRLRWITAAAAAVALLAGAFVAADALRGNDTAPKADPAPLRLTEDLSSTTVLSALGRYDATGPLAARETLTGCLAAAGLDRAILGSRDVVFGGQNAALVLLTGPEAPAITAVVLGADCTPDDPRVLANTDIG